MKSGVANREPDFELNISAYSLADEHFRAGRFEEALKLFKVSLNADPSDGDAFHAIGSCYDALKKPFEAAAAYRSALAVLPEGKHPTLHFNIGNALYDLGQFAEALEEYRLVPADSPAWPAASKNGELALEMMGHGG